MDEDDLAPNKKQQTVEAKPKTQNEMCQECLKKAGVIWDHIAIKDLRAGICPKITDRDVFVCEEADDKPLIPKR